MSLLKIANDNSTSSTPTTTGKAASFNFAQAIEDLHAKAEGIVRSIDKFEDPTPRITALKKHDTAAADQLTAAYAKLKLSDLLTEATNFSRAVDETEDNFASVANVNFNADAKQAIAKLERQLRALERHLGYANEDYATLIGRIEKLEAAKAAADEEKKSKKAAKAPKPAPADDPDDDDASDASDDGDDEDDVPLSHKFDNLPTGRLAKFEARLEAFQTALASDSTLFVKDPKSGKRLGYYQRGGKKYYLLDDIEDIDEPGVVFGYLDGKKFHPVQNDMAEYIVQAVLAGATGDLW